MTTIECRHNKSIPSDILKKLGKNQGGVGHHKCVICAYSIGLKDGQDKLIDFGNNDNITICKHNRKAITSRIKSLKANQNSAQGRHKCAVCAYSFGYEKGMEGWQDDFDADSYGEDEITDTDEIYDITQFGTSSDVATIYNRLKKGKYYVPKFQRDYVWGNKQASQLIESLIMDLPIPAIFLAKNEDRYYIIDGQQRLTSIQRFYDEEFSLSGVFKSINGKKYGELKNKHRDRLDEYSLQLIMIRQETPDDNNDSIYRIFERINTKGTKLSPQEIRTASYNGEFEEILSKYVDDNRWKNFIQTKNTRKTHEELILRFFALHFDLDNYTAPMKHFLNVYMSKNRKLKENSKTELDSIFNKVLDVVQNNDLTKEHISLKDSNRVNTQLLDSILVGIARNIENAKLNEQGFLSDRIKELQNSIDSDETESGEYWNSRRTIKENVVGRCDLVAEKFSK